MRIRKSQIQQDDVGFAFRKVDHGFTHERQMRHCESARSLLTEHLAEQARVSGVILNHENSHGLFHHKSPSRGNLTTASQKHGRVYATGASWFARRYRVWLLR